MVGFPGAGLDFARLATIALSNPEIVARMLAEQGVEPEGLAQALTASATPDNPLAQATAINAPSGQDLATEVGQETVTQPAAAAQEASMVGFPISPALIAGDTGVGAPNPSGLAGGGAASGINSNQLAQMLGLVGQGVQPAQPPAQNIARPGLPSPPQAAGRIDPAGLQSIIALLLGQQQQGPQVPPTLGSLIGQGGPAR